MVTLSGAVDVRDAAVPDLEATAALAARLNAVFCLAISHLEAYSFSRNAVGKLCVKVQFQKGFSWFYGFIYNNIVNTY